MSLPFPSQELADAVTRALEAARQRDADLAAQLARWPGGDLAWLPRDAPGALVFELPVGACHGVAYLDAETARKRASFVLEGECIHFDALLTSDGTPVKALMQGMLSLGKGRLPVLLDHIALLDALVRVTRSARLG